MSAIEVRFGKSFNPDAVAAVQELLAQTREIEPDFLLFFCSSKYDLAALGKAIEASFTCPAFGCTTAGEILGGEGYIEGSIVCAAVASGKISMRLFPIMDLQAFVKATADPMRSFFETYWKHSFALLLIDGLSALEEVVVGYINQTFKGLVPLIGASAADDFRLAHTYVYFEGAFHENAAVLAFFETSLPFQAFHIHHFVPTGMRLVVTEADPATRTVMEINGLPAADEYARAIGVTAAELDLKILQENPLILQAGGNHYVRATRQANPDGSLEFYCAVDVGTVLMMVKPAESLVANLERNLNEIQKTLKPALIFGSDCVARRHELQRTGELEEAKRALSRYPFIGLSTYGEQYYGVHVNHSLTALVLGDEA
ncbi:MAG: FIST C-terminal domain-containing protein [Zoogloeaceae bacterium]|jgi:hypothetical protein|nr:FIST C-terminal domain-containing protein [Zoogloeaceae bacterium]